MKINTNRPFSNDWYDGTSTLQSPPPDELLTPAIATKLTQLNELRQKLNGALGERESLHAKSTEEKAEKADKDDNAKAVASGQPIPGDGKANMAKLKAQREQNRVLTEALQRAVEMTAEAAMAERNKVAEAADFGKERKASETALLKAIDTLHERFATFAAIEARDAWMTGKPYEVRDKVRNLAILPGLYSPQTVHGDDVTALPTVIAQLKQALSGGEQA